MPCNIWTQIINDTNPFFVSLCEYLYNQNWGLVSAVRSIGPLPASESGSQFEVWFRAEHALITWKKPNWWKFNYTIESNHILDQLATISMILNHFWSIQANYQLRLNIQSQIFLILQKSIWLSFFLNLHLVYITTCN